MLPETSNTDDHAWEALPSLNDYVAEGFKTESSTRSPWESPAIADGRQARRSAARYPERYDVQ